MFYSLNLIVTPLQQQAVLSSPIGGDFLTDCLTKSLESKGMTVRDDLSFVAL